jgi:hypothetical protein
LTVHCSSQAYGGDRTAFVAKGQAWHYHQPLFNGRKTGTSIMVCESLQAQATTRAFGAGPPTPLNTAAGVALAFGAMAAGR